jgi:DNA-binding transcriptional LysR family regulator
LAGWALLAKLFDRLPSGTVPTTIGTAFLEQARIALREADWALEIAHAAVTGMAGRLKVATASGAMFSLLPMLLRDFRAKYPGIALTIQNLTPDDQIAHIAEGAVDVGFTRISPCSPSLTLKLVLAEPYLVALPSKHHFASRKSLRLKDLSSELFVMLRPEGRAGFHHEVLVLCEAAGFAPRIAQEIATMDMIVSLVDAELGIAVVSDPSRVLAFPGAVCKPLRGLKHPSRLYLAMRNDRRTPVCNSFIDFAHAHCHAPCALGTAR